MLKDYIRGSKNIEVAKSNKQSSWSKKVVKASFLQGTKAFFVYFMKSESAGIKKARNQTKQNGALMSVKNVGVFTNSLNCFKCLE